MNRSGALLRLVLLVALGVLVGAAGSLAMAASVLGFLT